MTISFTCSEKVSSDVVSSHLIRDLLNVLIFVLGVTNSHISVNMLHYSVAVRPRVGKKNAYYIYQMLVKAGDGTKMVKQS